MPIALMHNYIFPVPLHWVHQLGLQRLPTENKEKKEKRTQKKVRKKNKKGSRSHNTVFEPPSSSISDHFALPEELTAPLHTPADTSTSSSQVAPRPHRRSTACAKLLVRAGLR